MTTLLFFEKVKTPSDPARYESNNENSSPIKFSCATDIDKNPFPLPACLESPQNNDSKRQARK